MRASVSFEPIIACLRLAEILLERNDGIFDLGGAMDHVEGGAEHAKGPDHEEPADLPDRSQAILDDRDSDIKLLDHVRKPFDRGGQPPVRLADFLGQLGNRQGHGHRSFAGIQPICLAIWVASARFLSA